MKTTKTYLKGCDWCNATGQKFPMEHNGTSFSSLCPVCNGAKTILVTEVTEPVAPQENIRELPDIDFRKDIAEELSRDELINRLCEMHKSYTEMREEWFNVVHLANRPEEEKVSDEDIEKWAIEFTSHTEHYFHSVKDLQIGAKAYRDGLI
jgi:hypothetical protein